ncbi:hypothetical protein B0H10DRAFT_1327185 [Mycena sp. CBHHK59/15]|nr:hypothetical protein B0H10DRAFT_1327185 [Mycena sp. CBHHK59/15]
MPLASCASNQMLLIQFPFLAVCVRCGAARRRGSERLHVRVVVLVVSSQRPVGYGSGARLRGLRTSSTGQGTRRSSSSRRRACQSFITVTL